jgi:hypothetical protein
MQHADITQSNSHRHYHSHQHTRAHAQRRKDPHTSHPRRHARTHASQAQARVAITLRIRVGGASDCLTALNQAPAPPARQPQYHFGTLQTPRGTSLGMSETNMMQRGQRPPRRRTRADHGLCYAQHVVLRCNMMQQGRPAIAPGRRKAPLGIRTCVVEPSRNLGYSWVLCAAQGLLYGEQGTMGRAALSPCAATGIQ